MSTVGKVETGCIHAPLHQPAQDAFVLGGGPSVQMILVFLA